MSLFLITNSSICIAKEKKCYSDLSEVMSCFVNYEDAAYNYKISDMVEKNNYIIRTYILESQKWPIYPNEHIPTTIWKHKLVIYTPKEIEFTKALFYVSGGYSSSVEGKEEFSPSKESLDFVNIALNNKAPVVVLEDVPNQFLFIDSLPKKEDQILAYTYKMVMQDPMENAYLAGHLPMVKSIVKAMDAVEDIFSKDGVPLKEFVLVGASKRGWAAWLAAIEDSRVSALIPVVIDILNVGKNINHICNSYIDHCPPALRDYKNENVLDDLYSAKFKDLMKIDDPFSYVDIAKYSKQFSIPKYIINTSGDDFYAPDSSKFYFSSLKGENYIRYLPNAMHYLAGNPISNYLNNMKHLNEAVNNFFYFHINNVSLPDIKWKFSANELIIDSSLVPIKVKLWTANNLQERDFRFLNSYSKIHLGLKTAWIYLEKYMPFSLDICDTCYKEQLIDYDCAHQDSFHIDIRLPKDNDGWQASFAELFYNIEGREFIVTTEVNISPDTYP